MKRVLFIIYIILFLFIKINALEVNNISLYAENEIAGAIQIKGFISVNKQKINEPFIYKIRYKDSSLKEFDKSTNSLKKSNIYNASSLTLYNIGEVKKGSSLNDILNTDLELSQLDIIKFEEENDEEFYTISFYPNKEGNNIYYIHYAVTNVLVTHNDCAELYYRFIDDLDYDVKKISLVTSLSYTPNKNELYKAWAHGNGKITTKLDKEKYILYSEINNYKKGGYLDNRIIFDKNIYSLELVKEKVSNMDAVDKIINIENERSKNTQIKNIILKALHVSLLILLTLIIFYITNILIKNKKGK